MPSFRTARRILVTRSPHQASELADRLRAHGAEPVLIPSIETAEPSSWAALDHALRHIAQHHWLLFTSANAVEAFAARWTTLYAGALSLHGFAGLKIGAIGPATARALRTVALHPDLVPAQAIAESFTESLLPHVRQADGSPARFLLVRAEEAREHLPETLHAAGAQVTVVPAYRTVIPAGSAQAVREIFTETANWPDAITFTSSSTARNLLALCDVAGVSLPDSVLRVSIGAVTSHTLRELGYPPHAQASEATVACLAETVVKALHLQLSR